MWKNKWKHRQRIRFIYRHYFWRSLCWNKDESNPLSVSQFIYFSIHFLHRAGSDRDIDVDIDFNNCMTTCAVYVTNFKNQTDLNKQQLAIGMGDLSFYYERSLE